tara:strand:+ start:22084 stop:22626 length:543 start_codon:yes stop_codon:yes gene_type:complete
MILKESELDDQDIIRSVIGYPYKEPGKFFTATGSTIYFVKEIIDLNGAPLPLKREEMKAIYQRYEKGLMLFLTKSNYQNGILISKNSIKKITLSKIMIERDFRNPLMVKIISQFNLVLDNTFLSVLKSIYNLFKYSIRETVLLIETDFFKAKMITSYSSFNSQVKYFESLGLGNKIEIIN